MYVVEYVADGCHVANLKKKNVTWGLMIEMANVDENRYFISYTNNNVIAFRREIQAASGEWVNEYARGPSRRDSLTNEYIPASDIIKKGIRRSWTISSEYFIRTHYFIIYKKHNWKIMRLFIFGYENHSIVAFNLNLK